MGRTIADEDDPGVVGHVQPLVGIGAPRVGAIDALGEVPQSRAGSGPQPEGPVDVQPGVRMSADDRDDPLDRVERSGVHLADLGAHDRRLVAAMERLGEGQRIHAALVVDR